MLASSAQGDPPRSESATRIGKGNGARASDVLPGERALAHARHRPRENDLAAGFAAAGTQLDHVVGHLDRSEIVLHHQHAVARIP